MLKMFSKLTWSIIRRVTNIGGKISIIPRNIVQNLQRNMKIVFLKSKLFRVKIRKVGSLPFSQPNPRSNPAVQTPSNEQQQQQQHQHRRRHHKQPRPTTTEKDRTGWITPTISPARPDDRQTWTGSTASCPRSQQLDIRRRPATMFLPARSSHRGPQLSSVRRCRRRLPGRWSLPPIEIFGTNDAETQPGAGRADGHADDVSAVDAVYVCVVYSARSFEVKQLMALP